MARRKCRGGAAIAAAIRRGTCVEHQREDGCTQRARILLLLEKASISVLARERLGSWSLLISRKWFS